MPTNDVASPEIEEVSGEAAETIEVDGVQVDVDLARAAVSRCVEAIIVIRRYERIHRMFPEGHKPPPMKEWRDFTRELSDILTGAKDAEDDQT